MKSHRHQPFHNTAHAIQPVLVISVPSRFFPGIPKSVKHHYYQGPPFITPPQPSCTIYIGNNSPIPCPSHVEKRKSKEPLADAHTAKRAPKPTGHLRRRSHQSLLESVPKKAPKVSKAKTHTFPLSVPSKEAPINIASSPAKRRHSNLAILTPRSA